MHLSTAAKSRSIVRFGVFQFNLGTAELVRDGIAVHLQPQPARLLRLLLLNAGELVTRETIQAQLWGDGTTVDFQLGVNRCTRQLRAALLDDADVPRYIQTISRLGYRFIAPVSSRPSAGNAAARAPAPFPAWEQDGPLSIVVLPFANLSGGLEDEYFSDGLTEEITNSLAQIANLKVTARTSAFTFKGKSEDIRTIAQTLGVNHVLEGSVRRAGVRLRITAHLISAEDNTRLLSNRYDREMTDILAVQDEISSDIADQLELKFTTREKASTNVAAYEKFLEGRFHWHKYTPAGFEKALHCFQQSIAIDPTFARGYAGIAEYYVVMVTDAGAPARDFLPKAALAARRALELNGNDADAHAVLGQVASMLEYDWAKAKLHFRNARELNPSSHARMAYIMWYLIPRGKITEALAECEAAIRQDPLLLLGRSTQASALIFARSYEAGAECCLRALEMDADFAKALQLLANARSLQGRHEESMELAEHLVRIIGRSYLGLCQLGMVQALAGDRAGARRTLEELLELPRGGHGAPTIIACTYAALGDAQNALVWMQQAIEERDPRMLWMNSHPWTDPLRLDTQFQQLMAKMNLC